MNKNNPRMIFVPDEAILRSNEITSSAFRLFVFYCTQVSSPDLTFTCSIAATLKALSASRPAIIKARHELTTKGWISITDDSTTSLQMGRSELVAAHSESPAQIIQFPSPARPLKEGGA